MQYRRTFMVVCVCLIAAFISACVKNAPVEARKALSKQTKWAKASIDDTDMRGLPVGALNTKTTLAKARTLLGFDLKLPTRAEAAAAGGPDILGGEGVDELVPQGAAPRPNAPNTTGAAIEVRYPNGLKILVEIRHPKDATLRYRQGGELQTGQLAVGSETIDHAALAGQGYVSPGDWERTVINGRQGMQIEKGWVFNGSTAETPTEDRREEQPAAIVWYDDENWAQYSANGPIGVPLSELRAVVESMR